LFSYKRKKLLTGILYLHDIQQRVICSRDLRAFEELCGEDALKCVVVVTNMWGLVDKALGEQRERSLQTDETLFKGISDQGATFMRHGNSRDSAHMIVASLLNRRRLPERLAIQIEMVDQEYRLDETNAAAALLEDFDQLIRNLKGKIGREERFLARAKPKDRTQSEAKIRKMKAKVEELKARKRSLRKGGIPLQRSFLKFVKIFGLRF
jgi:hypothetical protein